MVLTFYIVMGILLPMFAASLVWWLVDIIRGARKKGTGEASAPSSPAKKQREKDA